MCVISKDLGNRRGHYRASLVAQMVKHLPAMQETWVQSLGQEDPLEKEMGTHSSTLAWRIPWTEEPGRLQSTGSQRVGHDWATSLSCIGEGNGNPLQCSCLENPRDGGAWWAAVYGVTQSRTRLKWLSSSSSSSMKDFNSFFCMPCSDMYFPIILCRTFIWTVLCPRVGTFKRDISEFYSLA